MQYLAGVSDTRTATGLSSRKMLMWAFLGSDCMFFGSLITAHLIYRNQGLAGPQEDIFNIPVTSVSTFVLLMSSLAMVLGLAGLQAGRLPRMRFWLSVTALFGMIFIGFQMYEFNEFAHEGLTPRTSLFGSTFFTLTGFHGAHVTLGVFWLWTLVLLSFRGKVTTRTSLDVEIAGLYWHFVDIVWIVIFGVVYLIGALGAEGRVLPNAHALSAFFA